MDIQDPGERSDAGNWYILIAVDKANKFVSTFSRARRPREYRRNLYTWPAHSACPSLRRDLGTEFLAEVVTHSCQGLNVIIDYEFGTMRESAERLG